MEKIVRHVAMSFDDDGRILSIINISDATNIIKPYKAEHITLAGRALTDTLPALSFSYMQECCPFCAAPLHMASDGHYCYNIHCHPRKTRVITSQLQNLDVPYEVHRDVMNKHLHALHLGDPCDLLSLLSHLESEVRAYFEVRWACMSAKDYAGLLMVPYHLMWVFEDIAQYASSVAELHFAVVNGFLFNLVQDAVPVESLTAARLSAAFINRDFADRLMALTNKVHLAEVQG